MADVPGQKCLKKNIRNVHTFGKAGADIADISMTSSNAKKP
jgi:hypothetical protein